jgi:hypothetical protein
LYDSLINNANGANDMTFNTNQIVKGKAAGQFIILGQRTIGGEQYYQVKAYNPATGKAARGEFALPATALQAI